MNACQNNPQSKAKPKVGLVLAGIIRGAYKPGTVIDAEQGYKFEIPEAGRLIVTYPNGEVEKRVLAGACLN